MNKKSGLILTVFIFSIFLINFVSANELTEDAVEYAKKILNQILTPLAELFFGEIKGNFTGELLFAKVLFFVIIISIIWKAIEQVDFFSEHAGVHWLVAIAASILATRWLSSAELIKTILLPYTTIGIAISAGIPFVLWFIIVNIGFKKPQHKTIRRIAWIFFAVIFTGLWITRSADLSANNSKAYLIYPVTAILAFLMAWFDGTIRKWFLSIELDKVGSKERERERNKLLEDLSNFEKIATNNGWNTKEKKRERKKLMKEIKDISM